MTDGGGGTINYTYTKNDTLQAIGPAPGNPDNVKQKQSEYDGLARLASVCEITTGTGSGTCGQSSTQTGLWTQYTYDALGDMTGVTQNAQAASGSRETRAYAYDMLGRLTSEQNPETGGATAISYTYDSSDSTCGSYTSAGDLVEKKDAVGNYSCYQYDGMHRVTSLTYPAGSYAARTDQKHYVYDSATVGGTAMGNAKGRLAEAYTCGSSCTPKKTDVGFSYSARGEVTDAWESTPNSGGYYHPTAAFWANGALKTLWISSLPVISYGADGEGRASTVGASSGQNPVTSTAYNTASQVTSVTYGTADSDAFTFDPNTGRMTQYKYTVNGSSEIGGLTWNPNGSLKTLAITDPFNAGDNQTCNYLHDDLSRVASVSCGSVWAQTFSFDAFGNITKSGSISWQPGYAATTNQYTLAGTHYDTNGNLTNDTFHAYTWDSESNPDTIDAVGLTYDAFDRAVEQNPSAGVYYQIVYTPMGSKLGLFKAATIQQLYIPLPGGAKAEYLSWGLSHYRHADWLGSDRLEVSSSAHTILDNNAYAPFGEPYAQTGNGEISFTGQNKDTDWLQYDFMFRQYDPKQGRWISPDRAGMGAVDPANPQSWNRYAYVMNSPLNSIDPFGLRTCLSLTGPPYECPDNSGPDDGSGDGPTPPPQGGSEPCTQGLVRVNEVQVCGPSWYLELIQAQMNRGQNPGPQNTSAGGSGSTPPNPQPPDPKPANPQPPNPKPGPPKESFSCGVLAEGSPLMDVGLISLATGQVELSVAIGAFGGTMDLGHWLFCNK